MEETAMSKTTKTAKSQDKRRELIFDIGIDGIVRMIGSGHYFEDLEVLQKAIEKRGALSKDYFDKDENYCGETWGAQWRSKEELRLIRSILIEKIVEIINSQSKLPYKEKMELDHYARYLHALTILKTDKNTFYYTKDYFRDAMLELWKLDDGSKENWKAISNAAWFLSEACKVLKGKRISKPNYPDE